MTIYFFFCIAMYLLQVSLNVPRKKWGENPKTNNIILDCAIWEILSDPVIKDCYNEHMQRQS